MSTNDGPIPLARQIDKLCREASVAFSPEDLGSLSWHEGKLSWSFLGLTYPAEWLIASRVGSTILVSLQVNRLSGEPFDSWDIVQIPLDSLEPEEILAQVRHVIWLAKLRL